MAPLKKGGGQNVGLNFLVGLGKLQFEHELIFVVAENSLLHEEMTRLNHYQFIVAPRNPLLRIMWEFFILTWKILFLKIDIIYSYFGYSFVLSRSPQVSGSADSNLYFPEVDFWCDYSWARKLLKKLVDKYRILILRLATAVVFENYSMLHRGKKLFALKNVEYIKPSVAELPTGCSQKNHLTIKSSASFKVLVLCGWQLNKNIMMIPCIAAALKERGHHIGFVVTAPLDESPEHHLFQRLIEENDVSNQIVLLGSVGKIDLPALYEQSDAVLLLSRLESFSNNIIEAWHYERPLIISDREWARSICFAGAVYVDRNDSDKVAEAIIDLKYDAVKYAKIVSAGKETLASYPTVVERTKLEIQYLERVYDERISGSFI